MKVIAVLTGSRAEYGLLKYTMQRIKESDEMILRTIVTGMHLSPKFGNTGDEIASDGFEIDTEVHMLLDDDSEVSTAKSVGIGITGISQALDTLQPDVLLLLGDRVEVLAGGIAASTMNIPVAHIAGGSIRGGGMIDESIRHALTRFAHFHFVQSDTDKHILQEFGEERNRIHLVGAPALDKIHQQDFTDRETILQSLGLNKSKPIIVVLQHPISTEPENAGIQMEVTLDAISEFDVQTIIIHPNSDPGREKMAKQIKQFKSDNPDTLDVENLPREDYLGLLQVADILIGNSSSGIIEAPCFELPTIDVGSRQGKRDRPDTVTRCPHDREKIREEIQKILCKIPIDRSITCENSPYYHGGAANKIVEILTNTKLDRDILNKEINID